MSHAPIAFVTRQKRWSARQLIGPLERHSIRLSEEQLRQLEPSFWNFLCSEYDARNLHAKVMEHCERLSDEFLLFLGAWSHDEANHTIGFKLIYKLFYDVSEHAIEQRLHERPVDFSRIEDLIQDEFSLALVLAYDELATTHAYHRDLDLYASFGPPEMNEWIRNVRDDEALHLSNLLRFLRARHPSRLGEVRRVLGRIVELDRTSGAYGGTFVLDHSGEGFGLSYDELTRLCAEPLIRKLERESEPSPLVLS